MRLRVILQGHESGARGHRGCWAGEGGEASMVVIVRLGRAWQTGDGRRGQVIAVTPRAGAGARRKVRRVRRCGYGRGWLLVLPGRR